MKNKILIPLLIAGALATFFSFTYTNADTNENVDARRSLVLKTVVKAIHDSHYSPKNIDDSLSKQVYDKVLAWDYDKKFFTQADVNILQAYKYKIDDEINDGSVEFFNKFNELFVNSLDKTEAIYKDILAKPFTFTADEQFVKNGEDMPFAKDDAELKEYWRKYLKFNTLAKYVDLKKDQEKKKDSANFVAKTDAQLEEDARTAVRKSQEFTFKRLRKMKDDDRFTFYVNSITGAEDPHTDYMPPREKQAFDEGMSGSFSGIGAQLGNEDGKIKIVSIIPGSPSWKQGQLKAGDEILKVAQGADQPEDIQGWDIDDVVKKIRGKKGTEVRLTVKKVNGAQQVIPIIRGDVLMEEVFAKSAIINSKTGPVGYIYLPEFYADFNKIGGRRSAEDVAIEVQKLKNAGVTGIILDLRYNGGGSLSDVVDMAGLFIDEGPVVQVKSSNSTPMMLRDAQKGTLYDGPLAVMVNQQSASASEIMAAVLQDYKRAVIVGTTTFGKGTVQKVMSLDEVLSWSESVANKGVYSPSNPIGSLKLTVQKFYRVNGGSTQQRGVTPDIVFPDPYKYIEMGERKDKASLKWDEIPAAAYHPVKNAVNANSLAMDSKKRVSSNATFSLIEENALRLKKQEDDKSYSLNEANYRKELDDANATSKKMEELEKKASPLTITNPKEDMARINMDSTNVKKNQEWIKNLQKDIYLAETVNIVNDLTKQQVRVNMGTGMK
ncbi:carboxy terminal-processing peptidase [Polluticoccus soli]|uniref:carboxy terminal-processing peptidase n=1 Tax=Polluticoccus soli TaxID=3034150 RepID=UPI0023E099B9|nr:carboxy terminal-processing peptidase [Flavipsychrobacter sp. JY13-12]